MEKEALVDPRSDRELIITLVRMVAAVNQQNKSILKAIDNLALRNMNDQIELQKRLQALDDIKSKMQALYTDLPRF